MRWQCDPARSPPFPPGEPIHQTALVLKNRLPAIEPWRMYVDAGGLMVYGMSLREMDRRTAVYVDKILKGAKPGESRHCWKDAMAPIPRLFEPLRT